MRYVTNIDNKMECYHVNVKNRMLSIAVSMEHDLQPRNYAMLLRRAAQWFDDVADGKVALAPCHSDCQMKHEHAIL